MIKLEPEELRPSENALIQAAIRVRKFAYAPYSLFKVGAAVADESGSIHTGCNVETSDFSGTTHAEGAAIDSMVKHGNYLIKEIAIAMNSKDEIPVPCGMCLQKISDFSGNGNSNLFLCNIDDDDKIIAVYRSGLKELLPFSFSSKHFKDN